MLGVDACERPDRRLFCFFFFSCQEAEKPRDSAFPGGDSTSRCFTSSFVSDYQAYPTRRPHKVFLFSEVPSGNWIGPRESFIRSTLFPLLWQSMRSHGFLHMEKPLVLWTSPILVEYQKEIRSIAGTHHVSQWSQWKVFQASTYA